MINDGLKLNQSVAPQMLRGRGVSDDLEMSGKFQYQLFDALGNPLTAELTAPNGITTLAKSALFNAFFKNGTRWTNWYVGLMDAFTYVTILPTDSMVSHSGWTEFLPYVTFDDIYGPRIAWGQGTASGGQITNSAQIVFKFTNNGSVIGIFVSTDQVKEHWEPTGMLWSTALFAAPLSVADGDQLRVTYTISA